MQLYIYSPSVYGLPPNTLTRPRPGVGVFIHQGFIARFVTKLKTNYSYYPLSLIKSIIDSKSLAINILKTL